MQPYMIATIYCINISYQYFVSIVTMIKWRLISMAVILCVNILTVNLRLCPPPYSADSKPPRRSNGAQSVQGPGIKDSTVGRLNQTDRLCLQFYNWKLTSQSTKAIKLNSVNHISIRHHKILVISSCFKIFPFQNVPAQNWLSFFSRPPRVTKISTFGIKISSAG